MRFFALTFSIIMSSAVLTAGNQVAAQDRQFEDELIPPLTEPQEPALPDEEALTPPVDDVPLTDEGARTGREKQLDNLFARLKKTRSERAAKRLASNIWSQWFRSGSASIDLLMQWSNEASQRKDYNIALDLLDQVTTREPDYAEGWNRRATLHFSMSNYSKSMSDIQKVLALEPRHFGALSGMAIILERSGRKEAALDAWSRALSVYPAMRSAQDAVIRLSDELGGEPV